MRIYFSENEHEWSKSSGTHYGCKVKLSRTEYQAVCKKANTKDFGYIGDPYPNPCKDSQPEIRFTHSDTGIMLFYYLGIMNRYRRNNVCIEIR